MEFSFSFRRTSSLYRHYITTLSLHRSRRWWGYPKLVQCSSCADLPMVSSSFWGACTYTPPSHNDFLLPKCLSRPARSAWTRAAERSCCCSFADARHPRRGWREVKKKPIAPPFFFAHRAAPDQSFIMWWLLPLLVVDSEVTDIERRAMVTSL